MAPRYNPPPNWPTPPAGWTPSAGWTPDPAWGPVPEGWQLWTDDGAPYGMPTAPAAGVPPRAGRAARAGGGCLKLIGAAVVLVIVLVVVLAIALGGSAKKKATTVGSGTTAHPAAADVQLGTCTRDDATGWYTANLTVTNHSSKSSNYIIEVGLQSADGATKYDNLLASVSNLASGQSSPQKAQSLTQVPAGAVCKVDKVTRLDATG